MTGLVVSAPGLPPQRGADPYPVRLAAVKDFSFFVRHVIDDFYGKRKSIDSRMGFHEDLARFISRPRSQRKAATLVICPRGFLKSTYCTILHSLWALLVDPDETIMVMHGIEKTAFLYFDEIARIATTSPVLRWIAPDIFGQDPSRDLEIRDHTMRVICPRGDKVPSISCFGMNSTTAGNHYSLYKLDDLVNDTNYETPDGIDTPIKKFTAVMNTERNINCRVDVMDTVYANDDLTQWLQNPDGKWAEDVDIFHRRWYVESRAPWGPTRLKPDGSEYQPDEESWWPEVKSLAFIGKKKRTTDPVAFAQQFLCEPAIDGARLYRREWVKRYPLGFDDLEMPVLPGSAADESGAERRSWRIDMALDAIAAEASTRSKDKACIVVGARNDLGELWLLDLYYDRPTNADWYDTVHRFWCRWRPQRMPMEQVGLTTALYRSLDEDGRRRGVRYPLHPSRRDGGGHGTLAKTKRAQAIQGFIQRGELFMPEGELWTGPMREIESYQYGIKEQRDDFIDCIFDLWDLPKPAPPSRVAAAESAWGVAPMPGQPRRFGMREVARRRA